MTNEVVDIKWSVWRCCFTSSERVVFPITEISFVSTSSSYGWARLTLVALLCIACVFLGLFAGQRLGSNALVIGCLAASGVFGCCFLVTVVRMCRRTVPVTFFLRHTQWYGSNVSHTVRLRHSDATALVSLVSEKMGSSSV